MFDASKNRVDFYIFSPDGDFGIDVFYTETMKYLQSNINIKMSKYRNFPLQLFLVAANLDFKQEDLDKYVASKIKPLSPTTKLVTLETLMTILRGKEVYPNPLK